VVGLFALVAALVVGVVGLVRRLRRRPARRAGLTAAGLTGAALALLIAGTAVGIPPASTTAAADQPATTPTPTATSPAATTAPSVTPTVTTIPTAAPTTTPPSATAAVTTPPPPPQPSAPAPTAARVVVPVPARTVTRSATGPAATALAALAVKGRAAKTGYSRDAFGPAWADVDRNGCDTRDDVLRRDLTSVAVTAGTGGCEVTTGTLADPYSGTRIPFTRGVDTSSAVQIDHVVALSNAWQTGADAWSPNKREAFANDPLNLLAVQGRLNEQKSDGDSATWLPPATGIRCAYVARQVAVKAKYGLWVIPPEQAATTRILTGCPGQSTPIAAAVAVPAPLPDPAAPVTAEPVDPAPAVTADPVQPVDPVEPVDPPAGTDPVEVVYPNCAAVRAAGKAPIHRGESGYSTKLDRDRDGIACDT